MWLEHAVVERSHLCAAVMVIGSYPNTDHSSGKVGNEQICTNNLLNATVPIISALGGQDDFTNDTKYPVYARMLREVAAG